MLRKNIRKKVNHLVKKYETNDPFELCNYLGIDVAYDHLQDGLMGYRTVLYRISCIVLGIDNSEQENFEVCCHELGHHICGHNTNTEYLKSDNRLFVSYGVEYEANIVLVELLLHDVNLAEYPTRECLLRSCGIPDWAEHYVDWQYLEETTVFNSFNSYY